MNVKLLAATMARLNDDERRELADLLDDHVCRECHNSGAVDRNGRIVACSCGRPMVQPLGGDR